MATDQCNELFDKEAQIEAENVLNSNGTCTAGKEFLSRIIWNQSLQATLDAKVKGKKQVRYHSIMIRTLKCIQPLVCLPQQYQYIVSLVIVKQ